jgi:voltage-gated potassium channel
LIGFIEGWSVSDAIYFTFVTGLTIGYGDIVT